MNRLHRAIALITTLLGMSMSLTTVVGCGNAQPAADLHIEALPEVHPSLPAVPSLPPPPFPVQLPDQTYTVYGLRKRLRNIIDTEIQVTAYVVAVYTPPECPEGRTCPPARYPHVFLADTAGEADATKRITLTAFAENQTAIDEAVEYARRHNGQGPAVDPESGEIPVPFDLNVGAKIKLRARFTRVSSVGFAQSDGLLEYRGHEILEPAPAPEGERRR